MKILVILVVLLILPGCFLNASLSSLNELNSSNDNDSNPNDNTPNLVEINFQNPSEVIQILNTKTIIITIQNKSNFSISNYSIENQNIFWKEKSINCPILLNPNESCEIEIEFLSNGDSLQNHTLVLKYFLEVAEVSFNLELQATGSFPGTTHIQETYPNFGANWNDYVKVTDFSKKRFLQDDTEDCTGTFPEGNFYNACIHGGERKKVRTGQLSCNDLSLTEDLGAFNWICDDSSGEAYFYTIGLKINKGLANLIEVNGGTPRFIPNKVTIRKNSEEILSSNLGSWWNNEIEFLPDNSATSTVDLTNSTGVGKIFVINSDQQTKGYNIIDDKISVVALNGSKLLLNTPNALFSLLNKKSIWFEGHFDGQNIGASYGLVNLTLGTTCNHCQIVNTKISHIVDGFALTKFYYSLIRNLEISHNYYSPLSASLGLVQFGTNNLIYNLNLLNNRGAGSLTPILNSHGENIFQHLTSIGNSGFTVIEYANSSTSIPQGNYIGITNINNSNNFRLSSEHNINFLSFLSINNNTGFDADNGLNDSVFSNLAFLNHSITGFELSPASGAVVNSKVTGVLLMGNNTSNCGGGGTSGLIEGTCAATFTDGTTDYGSQLSDAILRTNRDISSSFFGKVTSDTVNNSDTSGTASFNLISLNDFFNFENIYRFWSKYNAVAFPSTNHKGTCISGQTCQIWDFRLKSTDTVIRNISGDGANQNNAFINGQVCPNEINGNEAITDFLTPPRIYLRNAMEIPFDDIGNDNALCESNEACIYMPNIGAYQGHGDYTQNTCIFQDGNVSAVKMYAYPFNGF